LPDVLRLILIYFILFPILHLTSEVVRLGCLLEVLDSDVDKETGKVVNAGFVDREVKIVEVDLVEVCTVKTVELAISTVVNT
jgi:hypothetical protein